MSEGGVTDARPRSIELEDRWRPSRAGWRAGRPSADSPCCDAALDPDHHPLPW